MKDDLIRRSDILKELNDPKYTWQDYDTVEGALRNIPAVEAIPTEPDWKLYTKFIGDRPVAYRYGPSWEATALYVDGGYATPEEAKLAWLKYWEETRG